MKNHKPNSNIKMSDYTKIENFIKEHFMKANSKAKQKKS